MGRLDAYGDDEEEKAAYDKAINDDSIRSKQ